MAMGGSGVSADSLAAGQPISAKDLLFLAQNADALAALNADLEAKGEVLAGQIAAVGKIEDLDTIIANARQDRAAADAERNEAARTLTDAKAQAQSIIDQAKQSAQAGLDQAADQIAQSTAQLEERSANLAAAEADLSTRTAAVASREATVRTREDAARVATQAGNDAKAAYEKRLAAINSAIAAAQQ